jgi:hypothetical protein
MRWRVLNCARDLAPTMLGSGTGVEQWRDFGVTVVRRDLGTARGILQRTTRGPVVAVTARDHPRTQRYTVAHELAHLLIGDLDRRQLGLSTRVEEEICEAFASNLLIPRDDLDSCLKNFEDEPADLLALVRRYDVSLSALLTAAGARLADREVVAFAVSRRGHRKRPEEIALRVHRSQCGPYLMPEEVRLASLGFSHLDHCLAQLDVGADIAGSEVSVDLRLWRPGAKMRSGTATGPVSWRARRLPNSFTLVCLNTPALSHRWSASRVLV